MMERGSPTADSDYREGLVHKMKTTIHKIASSANHRHRGSDSATGSGGMPRSVALSARPGFILLALIAAIAVGMMFLAPNVLAQEAEKSVTYAEGETDPVVTLVARDPEGADIVWSTLSELPSPPPEIGGTALTATDIEDAADFTVAGGVLRFASTPNFESPADTGTNNVYNVVVQASDGGLSPRYLNFFKVTVTVTNEEEGGSIALAPTDQTGVTLLQPQVGVGITANLTDPDGTPTGTPEWQWYRGSSMSGPWTKIEEDAPDATYTPADTAGSSDVGMHLRVVASYTDPEGSGKSAEAVSEYVTLGSVANNTAPSFAEGTATTRAEIEGSSSGTPIGSPVTATDADSGEEVTYRLTGGGDDDKFSVDAKTGQLMVKTVLDYDAAGGTENQCATANSCTVTVTAYDSSGDDANDTPPGAAAITVTISVTGKDEAPSVSGPARLERVENGTDLNGPDGNPAEYNAMAAEAGTALTFSTAGADGDLFKFTEDADSDEADGVLAFKAAPDYEDPGDSDRDNVYEVTVVVSDGVNTGTQDVTVKVTGVEEDGSIGVTPAQPLVGVELTAELTDSDGVVTGPDWQWRKQTEDPCPAAEDESWDAATTKISGATSATYTPATGDNGACLHVGVSYTDRTFDDTDMFNESVEYLLPAKVQGAPTNMPPAFSAGTTARYLPEDADEEDTVGAVVTAKDANGDELAYTLSGADAGSFDIDRTSGQITVGADAKLDHETKPRLRVTVKARDPHGTTDTITVMIHVTDVDEAPTIADSQDSTVTTMKAVGEYPEGGTDPVVTLVARDPEGADIVWSILANAAGDQDQDGDGTDDVEIDDVEDAARFTAAGGVLRFETPPNFESAADSDTDNVYNVVVQASDGGLSTRYLNWFKVTVTVTNEEEGGSIALAPTDQTGVELLQPQVGVGISATLTDPDGATSEVTWKWYRTRSRAAAGTEIDGETGDAYTPVDTADSNDVGMYLRVVASYTDLEDAGKTAEAVSQYVTLDDVTDNAAPTFTEGEATTRAVIEGASSGTPIGDPVTATDSDSGEQLTYRLIGTDGDNEEFGIDAKTGQLKVGTVLDYDADSGPNQCATANSCTVTVTAYDSSGDDASDTPPGAAEITVTISVTGMNEAPSVSGPARIEHVENGTVLDTDLSDQALDAAEYTATDQDEDTALTFDLAGADADLFKFTEDTTSDEADGVLAFKAAPDYEDPGDSDRDNVYEVTVVVTDGVSTDTQAVTVKVTGVEEDGSIGVTPAQPRVGVELTAALTDSDGVVTGPSWQWARSDASGGEYTDIDGAKSATYTPVGTDDDMFLRVTATYTDRTFNPADSRRFNESVVQVLPAEVQRVTTNVAPAFSAETTVRYLPEDSTEADGQALGAEVGAEVTADDANGDDLAYTLSGADADSFAIDRTTGQITVAAKAGLDHETKPTLMVTVRARDPHDATDTITVMIHVTDVDEAPTIMEGGLLVEGLPSVDDYAENGTDVVAMYTVSGPDADGATWSLSGDDAGDFTISSGGALTFSSAPDFENAADSDGDNVYSVTVEANNAETGASDDQAVTVTVTDEAELGSLAGESSATYAENGTTTVATYTTDGPVDANWSLEGDDAGDFTIPGGALTFSASPDFENPADADTDNAYMVTVKAEAGGETDSIDVTITVTDVDDEVVPEMTPLERYDDNDSGRIDKEELVEAIIDYNVNETLEKADLVELIISYEVG